MRQRKITLLINTTSRRVTTRTPRLFHRFNKTIPLPNNNRRIFVTIRNTTIVRLCVNNNVRPPVRPCILNRRNIVNLPYNLIRPYSNLPLTNNTIFHTKRNSRRRDNIHNNNSPSMKNLKVLLNSTNRTTFRTTIKRRPRNRTRVTTVLVLNKMTRSVQRRPPANLNNVPLPRNNNRNFTTLMGTKSGIRVPHLPNNRIASNRVPLTKRGNTTTVKSIPRVVHGFHFTTIRIRSTTVTVVSTKTIRVRHCLHWNTRINKTKDGPFPKRRATRITTNLLVLTLNSGATNGHRLLPNVKSKTVPATMPRIITTGRRGLLTTTAIRNCTNRAITRKYNVPPPFPRSTNQNRLM